MTNERASNSWRCQNFRFNRGTVKHGLVAHGPAGDDDELVLLVEAEPVTGDAPREVELTVELSRGDELRSRRDERMAFESQRAAVAFRLHWGTRVGASSRLACRILVDGHEVARCEALGPAAGRRSRSIRRRRRLRRITGDTAGIRKKLAGADRVGPLKRAARRAKKLTAPRT